MSEEQLARRFSGDLKMRRIGTVFGWLTRPRDMYTFADVEGIPVNVFVRGGWGDCRFPYVLQGSP